MASTNIRPSKRGHPFHLWLADLITKPHPSVIGIHQVRVRMLSVLMLLCLSSAVSALFLVPIKETPYGTLPDFTSQTFMTLAPSLILTATFYALTRTKHHRAAAIGMSVLSYITISIHAIVTTDRSVLLPILIFLCIDTLIAAVFISVKASLFFCILNITTIVLFGMLLPGITKNDFGVAAIFVGIMSPILTGVAWYFQVFEQAQRKELIALNENLAQALEEAKQARAVAETAQQSAEEANRLKTEFLAIMSHELRTPLNAIGGFAEIIVLGFLGTDIPPRVMDNIQRILSNSKRLLALINDILDLAKIEAHRVEVAIRPINIRQLIIEIWEQNSSIAQQKGLQFTYHINPDLNPLINTDAELVRHMVVNLVSNALKFTHQGSVTIHIGNSDIPNHWDIRVTDTGIGIPPHAHLFIFDEFRQVDGSSSRAFGGTGLGLSIVRHYALLMGGSINLQSEVGKGSCFTLSLPLQVEITTLPALQDVLVKEAA